jgi:hypothetical protein
MLHRQTTPMDRNTARPTPWPRASIRPPLRVNAQQRLCLPARKAHYSCRMAVAVIFVLGIINFALNRAVMACNHPLMQQMPPLLKAMNQRFSLLMEYLMLVAGMLLAAQGWAWGAIAYGVYSMMNGFSAWLILSGRV